MVIGIIAVIFAFGLLILFHEFGHFIMAKKCGVKVEKFSFGLGPEVFAKEVRGTRYIISLIPFGGFVKVAGESPDESTGLPYEFFSQPWYKRILIVIVGPMMSYLLAFILFVLLYAGIGVWNFNTTKIGKTLEGMPARLSGFKPNDKIISIDGNVVNNWMDIATFVNRTKGKRIRVEFERDKKVMVKHLIPRYNEKANRYMIGIAPPIKKLPIHTSAYESIKRICFLTYFTYSFIVQLIAKMPPLKELKHTVMGPIGVMHSIALSAREGLRKFVFIIAVISTALAIFNLLPIPLLDGGHILLYTIEGISGKKLNKKILMIANTIGIIIIIWIFMLATYGDISRLLKW